MFDVNAGNGGTDQVYLLAGGRNVGTENHAVDKFHADARRAHDQTIHRFEHEGVFVFRVTEEFTVILHAVADDGMRAGSEGINIAGNTITANGAGEAAAMMLVAHLLDEIDEEFAVDDAVEAFVFERAVLHRDETFFEFDDRFDALFLAPDLMDGDTGSFANLHRHVFEGRAAPRRKFLGEAFVVDIDVFNTGLGHVLGAVGAEGVGDAERGIFGNRRIQNAGDFGVDGTAAVADVAVLAHAGFDQFGPVVGAGNAEFPVLTVKAEDGGGDFIDGMGAVVNDIDGALHFINRLETHGIR